MDSRNGNIRESATPLLSTLAFRGARPLPSTEVCWATNPHPSLVQSGCGDDADKRLEGPVVVESGMSEKLRRDPQFQPCPTEPGDELYPNGIFEFNITRMLAFVAAYPDRFSTEAIPLSQIPDYGNEGRLEQAAINAAELSRPILLAEIAPNRYNVIDGHHRVSKARRLQSVTIPAHRLRCPDHLAFLTSTQSYEKYVEYWNSKIAPRHGAMREP